MTRDYALSEIGLLEMAPIAEVRLTTTLGSQAGIGYRRLLSIAGDPTGYLDSPAAIAWEHMPIECFS